MSYPVHPPTSPYELIPGMPYAVEFEAPEPVPAPLPVIAAMNNDVPLLLTEAAETLEVAAKAIRNLKTTTCEGLWASLASTADDAIERAGGQFSDAMHEAGFVLPRE